MYRVGQVLLSLYCNFIKFQPADIYFLKKWLLQKFHLTLHLCATKGAYVRRCVYVLFSLFFIATCPCSTAIRCMKEASRKLLLAQLASLTSVAWFPCQVYKKYSHDRC